VVTGNLGESKGRKFENNFKIITDNEKELTDIANKEKIFNDHIKAIFLTVKVRFTS